MATKKVANIPMPLGDHREHCDRNEHHSPYRRADNMPYPINTMPAKQFRTPCSKACLRRRSTWIHKGRAQLRNNVGGAPTWACSQGRQRNEAKRRQHTCKHSLTVAGRDCAGQGQLEARHNCLSQQSASRGTFRNVPHQVGVGQQGAASDCVQSTTISSVESIRQARTNAPANMAPSQAGPNKIAAAINFPPTCVSCATNPRTVCVGIVRCTVGCLFMLENLTVFHLQ
jgi:hypothetical protein